MPRVARRIMKRYTEGTEVLDSETEETLLFGRGVIGPALELRTLDDWRRVWAKWRDVIMPKVLEHRPGTRPAACYVLREIAPRPVLTEPPLMNGYFKNYIPGRDGRGEWYYDYPEPFMRNEAKYLRDLGIVDAAEWKRHVAWKRRGDGPYTSPWLWGSYPLEQGLYQ